MVCACVGVGWGVEAILHWLVTRTDFLRQSHEFQNNELETVKGVFGFIHRPSKLIPMLCYCSGNCA